MGDYWQNFVVANFEHVLHALYSQKAIWVLLLSDTIEENWEVVMVIELLHVNLPANYVLDTLVLHLDWKITAVVKGAENRVWRIGPLLESTSLGGARKLFRGRAVKADGLAVALLQVRLWIWFFCAPPAIRHLISIEEGPDLKGLGLSNALLMSGRKVCLVHSLFHLCHNHKIQGQ